MPQSYEEDVQKKISVKKSKTTPKKANAMQVFSQNHQCFHAHNNMKRTGGIAVKTNTTQLQQSHLLLNGWSTNLAEPWVFQLE